MPQPYKTTSRNSVGPLLKDSLSNAFKECYDLNDKNAYWCYIEETGKLVKMVIDLNNPDDCNIAKAAYCGIRNVVINGINYTTMALSSEKMKQNRETPEQAYDRAMSVIGKR
jgi:hypothetical protein